MKIEVNPDKKFVKELREKIKSNDGYCLCALEKNDNTKCMCKEFINSNELGYCHCGLYNKVEK